MAAEFLPHQEQPDSSLGSGEYFDFGVFEGFSAPHDVYGLVSAAQGEAGSVAPRFVQDAESSLSPEALMARDQFMDSLRDLLEHVEAKKLYKQSEHLEFSRTDQHMASLSISLPDEREPGGLGRFAIIVDDVGALRSPAEGEHRPVLVAARRHLDAAGHMHTRAIRVYSDGSMTQEHWLKEKIAYRAWLPDQEVLITTVEEAGVLEDMKLLFDTAASELGFGLDADAET